MKVKIVRVATLEEDKVILDYRFLQEGNEYGISLFELEKILSEEGIKILKEINKNYDRMLQELNGKIDVSTKIYGFIVEAVKEKDEIRKVHRKAVKLVKSYLNDLKKLIETESINNWLIERMEIDEIKLT